MKRLAREIAELDEVQRGLKRDGIDTESRIGRIREQIESIEGKRVALEQQIPDNWQQARGQFEDLAAAEKKARQKYRRNADESYELIKTVLAMLSEANALRSLQPRLPPLYDVIQTETPDAAMAAIKAVAEEFGLLTNAHPVNSKLSKARRALRGNSPDMEKAVTQLEIAIQRLESEIAWRGRAANELMPELKSYDAAIQHTIGMRLQERLRDDQAESIATCLAVHKDISLYF